MALIESGKNILRIPFNFTPRDYQVPFYSSIDAGYRRGVAIWHRRAGKDKTALNLLISRAFLEPGTYYYLFPTYNQGRKILWDGMDSSGFKFLQHIPDEIIAKNDDGRIAVNNTEMKLRIHTKRGLETGDGYTSLIQVIGTDNYDQIMGTNPRGCIFSEYSIQNPRAWDFIRPILAENKGWAFFIYTPRGRNHGWDLWQAATENNKWFSQILTVDDTRRPDGSPVISKEDIEEEKKSGMSDDMVRQEFYCDFDIGAHGSFYGKLIAVARKENRIGHVPFDSNNPVHTAWDIGMGGTAIWFFQQVDKEIRLLRYVGDSGLGFPYYAALLEKIKDDEHKAGRYWRYGKHFFPHDVRRTEWGEGARRTRVAREAGIEVTMLKRAFVAEGIEYAKWLLPSCWFDAVGCADGIKSLEQYQRQWDEEQKIFKQTPKDNWATHGADAFRMLATAVKKGLTKQVNIDEALDMYQRYGPPARMRLNAH